MLECVRENGAIKTYQSCYTIDYPLEKSEKRKDRSPGLANNICSGKTDKETGSVHSSDIIQ